MCCVCQDAEEVLGAVKGKANDIRLGCGCAIHYICLVGYCRAKIGDRASLLEDGIKCPYGKECNVSEHGYSITTEDLSNIVDYGETLNPEMQARLKGDGNNPFTRKEIEVCADCRLDFTSALSSVYFIRFLLICTTATASLLLLLLLLLLLFRIKFIMCNDFHQSILLLI